jgi:hypothetical protein
MSESLKTEHSVKGVYVNEGPALGNVPGGEWKSYHSGADHIVGWFQEDYELYIGKKKIVLPEVQLTRIFGKAGCAAIMLYVMSHHQEMADIGCDFQIWDDDYNNRFKHEVWFRPGKVLTREWKVQPMDNSMLDIIRRINYHTSHVYVLSHVFLTNIVEKYRVY